MILLLRLLSCSIVIYYILWCLLLLLVGPGIIFLLLSTPWAQDVNWTYIKRSEDVQDVFWTSYVRSIYVLCLRGRIDIMSNTSIVTFKLLLKKQQILQNCFPLLRFFSVASMRSSYAFCIHLISFLLCDTMSGFPSVFIPNCINVRINSAVPNFSKQLSILSGIFSKSSISLAGCCCKRR